MGSVIALPGLLDCDKVFLGVITRSKLGERPRGGVFGSVKLLVVGAENVN
jgi:hypothetical protein